MKKIQPFLCALLLGGGLAATLWAQSVTSPDQLWREFQQRKASVEAFFRPDREEAMRVVAEEARNGKPYFRHVLRPEDLPKAEIPAFPGAQGGGAFTAGGRGGKVLVVTNLNDNGEGSFRWACEQGGARIVVFNVAGIIHLASPVKIQCPYITIAGQSAPGDGVCIAGETVEINTHDVIVRHMRFRRGNMNTFSRDDALGGKPVGNVIIDHCSASWGLDENMSFYSYTYEEKKYPTVNLTVQNCISSECLDCYNHAFGSTVGGINCTFYQNLWACNSGRNPSVGMGIDFNMLNCVLFNWLHRSVDGGDGTSTWNLIGNYYKPGPVTPKEDPVAYRIAKPDFRREIVQKQIFARIYASGNHVVGYPMVTRDNWDGGIQPEGRPDHELMAAVRVDEPFPMSFPIEKIKPAKKAYRWVLRRSGAIFPHRDLVDARVVRFVRSGDPVWQEGDYQASRLSRRRLGGDSYRQGIICDPAQVGGYPRYEGRPYTDTDHDGMPDVWETRYDLDPKDPSDAMKDCNGDGYANIEKFLNGINPRKRVDWSNPVNNRDPLDRRHRPLYGTNR